MYRKGCSTAIILEIIIRVTRERASTMKNLLARITEAEEDGEFKGTSISDAKERLKRLMPDYIKKGLVEVDKNDGFYKATHTAKDFKSWRLDN